MCKVNQVGKLRGFIMTIQQLVQRSQQLTQAAGIAYNSEDEEKVKDTLYELRDLLAAQLPGACKENTARPRDETKTEEPESPEAATEENLNAEKTETPEAEESETETKEQADAGGPETKPSDE